MRLLNWYTLAFLMLGMIGCEQKGKVLQLKCLDGGSVRISVDSLPDSEGSDGAGKYYASKCSGFQSAVLYKDQGILFDAFGEACENTVREFASLNGVNEVGKCTAPRMTCMSTNLAGRYKHCQLFIEDGVRRFAASKK